MCGRFALSAPAENIRKHFKIDEEVTIQPRFNIAPGQMINVVTRSNSGQCELVPMLWGLIPFWAKDRKIGYTMINARAETLEEKKSFRQSFQRYRCLVPADGFYEWKKGEGNKKQPYFIHIQNNDLFAFAGLWNVWKDTANQEIIHSCTIITTKPNTLLAEIHDRMPVILESHQYSTWLDLQNSPEDLNKMLKPYNPESMVCYPVTPLCNNSKNDSPECIKQI